MIFITAIATGVIREMGVGVTEPLLLECDDAEKYVVKFQTNPEGPKVLISEFVSHKLAQIFQIPVSHFSLINVPDDIVLNNPDFANISKGIQFGSRFQNIASPFSAKILSTVVNSSIIPDIVAFDFLVGNNDRAGNKGNLLFVPSHGQLSICVIDYSHAFFSPLWDQVMLNQKKAEFDLTIMTRVVYQKLVPFINGNKPFDRFLNNLARIDKGTIKAILDEVPDEWGLSSEESAALAEFVIFRCSYMETLLAQLKRYLPYWKGVN